MRRWGIRAFVAGLHLALLAALWLQPPPRPQTPAQRPATVVRLIAPPPRALPPPAPRVALPRALPAPAPIAPPPLAPAAAPAADGAPAPAAPAIAALPVPRSTLRLTLPPGWAASAAARNPALGDPRSNSVRPTLERRIANAAAVTADWVEERTSDGRTRRRRGDTCVETQESRIASIDRFNQNVAPIATPMTGQPYKCQ